MANLHSEKIKPDDAKLNFDEKKVLEVISKAGDAIHLNDIARKAFPQVRSKERPKSENPERPAAYRRTANALRRLAASRRVKKVKRGTYSAQ